MRQKVLSKEIIIDIAEEIIKEEGLDACTARYLAAKANCAIGTIYNYFDSRDDLLDHIFKSSWNKTYIKLKKILEEDLELNDKTIKIFKTIDYDIKNRGGVGEYLFKNIKDKDRYKETILFEISNFIMQLLKQSPKSKNYDEETLRINAEWIYFGLVFLRKRNMNMDLFYQQVIDKFF